MLTLETRVIRLDGGMGYQGMTGTVIAVSGGRVQVKWDDKLIPNFYDATRPPVLRKGKRTWVKETSLRVI